MPCKRLRLILSTAAATFAALTGNRLSAQTAQPGDRIIVRILGAEVPISDTLTVSSAGTAVFPKLGAVSVRDFPVQGLPDSLRARYAKYLRNPTVDLVVLRRVVVNGEVRKPDIYYVDIAATLPDVIAHAGGLTEFANSKKVSIRRGATVTPVPDWETTRSAVWDLQSGDQIFVGRRSWISQNFLAAASTAAVITSIFISLRK